MTKASHAPAVAGPQAGTAPAQSAANARCGTAAPEREAARGDRWLSFLAGYRVRPKLSVSAPGDPDEREADTVAERVVAMTAPTGAKLPIGAARTSGAQARACCDACGADDEPRLSRKATDAAAVARTSASSATTAVRQGGEPMGAAERAYFEPRFGRDLSHVRIHTGGFAARAASGIGARAYTVGRDIVFSAGAYDPSGDAGRRLLAHELAHVVQQGSGDCGRIHRMGDPSKIPAVLSCALASSSAPIPHEFVLFPNRSSSLSPTQSIQISNYVDRYHEAGSSSVVRVDGFASEPGDDSLNWQLSCNRASAVKNELVHPSAAHHPGIAEALINVVMQGETFEFGAEAENRRATIFPRIDAQSQSQIPQDTPSPQDPPTSTADAGADDGSGPTDAGVGDTPAPRPSCAENPECPADYCTPFATRSEARADRQRDGESILSTIASANSRAEPLFRRYVFNPGPAGDISAQHAGDFTSSRTTQAVTVRIHAAVRADIQTHPPAFPAGGGPATVNYETDASRSAVQQQFNGLATGGLIFDNPLEVPGLIAGGIGTTQDWCAVGADTSHSQADSRSARVTAEVFRNPDGTLLINPNVEFTVVDTIDFCPGNCGGFFAQHLGGTVQMSRWEASGISGDVPFTVIFPGPPLIGAYDSEDW